MSKNDYRDEKPFAYYLQVARNSKKNEYRSNANARKHTVPAGIDFDEHASEHSGSEYIEAEIGGQSPEDWLRFIDSQCLLAGLQSLLPHDLEFIFTMYKNGYTQRQMAEHLGVSQVAVHKRWKRILRKLRQHF